MISTIVSSFGISDILSLSIIFIIVYTAQYYYNYFTRPNPLPGPFPIPVLGNVYQTIGLEQNDWFMSLHKKYEDMFEVYILGTRIIVLCRADLVGSMNTPSTKTKYPIRRLNTEGFMEYTNYGKDGLGILNNIDHKTWKYNRQFFTQAMTAKNFNNQAVEWTNESWKEMESYWNKLGENRELDLIKWTRRFTSEMIFRISTGVKNNAIFSYYATLSPEINNDLSEKEKEKIKESEDYMRSFQILVDGYVYFVFLNKFIRHYVPFIRGKVKSLLKNRDYFYGRMYKIIEERRIEIENTPLDQPLRHDMLTAFITANTPRDISAVKHVDVDLMRPMTDKEIFGNISDTIGAGTDTTANLFCFIVYYLGHYPEVKQRLRQELETVLGNDLTRPITAKDLEELHYCDAVIKEVTRHCPIAFALSRVNVEKDEIGGFIWPERTSFRLHFAAMMKRKDYWTDPEKFDPDRFYKIEESDKYLLEKQHVKSSFTIFGGGIRICPGKKLAIIEIKSLLSSIYRKYDLELADINAPLKYKSTIVTVCDELMVKVKPRKFLN